MLLLNWLTYKAIKDLRTLVTEKVASEKYDKFWLDGFLERMKHDDVLTLKEILENANKGNIINELEKFIANFEKTLVDRKKDLHKQDKERAKVIYYLQLNIF
jgi:hypothetical protein